MIQNLETRVKEIIVECTDSRWHINDINLNDELSSIGVNSLIYMRLVSMLEEEFNIVFDDEMLIFKNIGTLYYFIQYVKEKLNQSKE